MFIYIYRVCIRNCNRNILFCIAVKDKKIEYLFLHICFSKNLLKSLFTTQKKCIRIMFGDQDAYMAKFETCARTRTFESRILGREFFQREPSKPLFCNNSLLTVHNLYKYHCIVEMFKVVKLRIPISIYELMKRSRRRDNYFISPSGSLLK